MEIFLSIIVPTYERSLELSRCLNSIDLDHGFEVIIADNASSYDPISFVPTKLLPFAKVTVRESNIGPRENIFQASHLSNGEYSIYITDDDYFLPGELSILLSQLKEKKPDIAYAACVVKYEKQKREKFYGFLPKFLGRAGVIIRGHVLSGLIVRTEELKYHLQRDSELLRKTWYISVGILCLIKKIPYLHSRKLLIHTWENKTFWGISSDDHKTLHNDLLSLYGIMRARDNINAIEYSLLKRSLTKYFSLFSKIAYYVDRKIDEIIFRESR